MANPDYTKIQLRPCVLEAAAAMELKLRKHDRRRGQRGWRSDAPINLLKRVGEELLKAFCEEQSLTRSDFTNECVDIMNMAMMARDAALLQLYDGIDVHERGLLYERPVRLLKGEEVGDDD